MKGGKFDVEYKRLNTAQREAVDTLEGPVMVVAGPGTGKTQVLTLRIANILKQTDTPPDAILALTFTEAAAREMKKRLVEIVGPAAYRVKIHTFHGYTNDVIQEYPAQFPRLVGATNTSEVERAALLEEIFDNLSLDKLRPYGDPYYYLSHARKLISDLKRESISPIEYAKIIKNKVAEIKASDDLVHTKGAHKGKMKGKYSDALEKLERLEEFQKVYQEYERLLAKRRLYDYDDMILEVVSAMEGSEDFKLRLSEECQYILADEHQDANGAQNKLLELLSSYFEDPNLFLVGDEKQAIFRFQGASLENFLYFKKRFPSAKMIVLTDNYRSTQGILDASHALIDKNKSELPRPRLISERDKNKKVNSRIRLAAFAKREYELIWLAGELKSLSDLGKVAVLVRENRDAELVAEHLAKSKIEYSLETEDDLLENEYVRQLVAMLRALDELGDDPTLVGALHARAFNLDPLYIYKLIREAADKRMALYDLLKKSEGAHIYRLMASWKSLEHSRGVLVLIEKMIEESGLLGLALASSNPADSLGALASFLEFARNFAIRTGKITLSNLLRQIELADKYDIKEKRVRGGGGEGVRIMTAHRSKGLEFDHVYIVFAEDGKWSNGKKKNHLRMPHIDVAGGKDTIKLDESEAQLADERRLFYVAITRGKHEVSISYSRFAGGKELLPTQFIAEIDSNLTVDVSPGADPEEASVSLSMLTPAPELASSLADGEFVREKFVEQGLSVSALNNYLECPWKYFYQSLLRVPRTPDKFSMYGSAMHEALSHINQSLIDGKLIGVSKAVELFKLSMSKMPLPKNDIVDSIKKGERALAGYYKKYANTWTKDILTEFDVKGVHLESGKDSVLLRGRIDKIEFLSGSEVNVVDYKTGKPKSRNVLLGKTHNSTGNEYRQILFYKILLDRYKDGRYKAVTGEIDFIEPNQSGKYVRESFEIDAGEVSKLEQEIYRVASEITSLTFWNSKCSDKKCEFCALRQMMK